MSFVITMRRSGLALAAVILAVLVIGAAVSDGFSAANRKAVNTRTAALKHTAESIAEVGLEQSIARLSATALNGYQLNAATTVANDVAVRNGGRAIGTYTVTVTRITPVEFEIKCTGAASAPAAIATHTVSRTIRLSNV